MITQEVEMLRVQIIRQLICGVVRVNIYEYGIKDRKATTSSELFTSLEWWSRQELFFIIIQVLLKSGFCYGEQRKELFWNSGFINYYEDTNDEKLDKKTKKKTLKNQKLLMRHKNHQPFSDKLNLLNKKILQERRIFSNQSQPLPRKYLEGN